jgi:hypothetical protein
MDPLKRSFNPKPVTLDPVYVPFEKDKEPPGAQPAEAYMLPEGVEAPEPTPEPEVQTLLTLKKLELDIVPTEDGKRLARMSVPQAAKDELAKLSAASGTKCRRCNGTGINGYKQKGAVAKVCFCVRQGAFLKAADDLVEKLTAEEQQA